VAIASDAAAIAMEGVPEIGLIRSCTTALLRLSTRALVFRL